MNRLEYTPNIRQSPENGPQSREQVRQLTSGHFGLAHAGRYAETGNPQDLNAAVRSFNTVNEMANRHKTAEEMVAAKDQILTKERIDSLPSLPGNISMDRRGTEQKQLLDIKMKLNATAGLKAEHIKRKRPSSLPQTYLVPHNGTYKLNRDLIETDLKFLNDPLRIDENPNDTATVDANREQVFRAYSDVLAELITLGRPEDERRYVGKYGSALAPQKLVESVCDHKTLEDVKGAGRFALLGIVTALAALWGIKDFRKGNVSIGTLGLVGGMMYLAQGDLNRKNEQFDFVRTEYFAELSRNGFDDKVIKKLQQISQARPAAMSHLIKLLNDNTGPGKVVTQEMVNEMIKPTNARGKPDPRRAIPEDIANLFLGQSCGGAAKSMYGIKKTARNGNLVTMFAKANSEHETVAQDLGQIHPETPGA